MTLAERLARKAEQQPCDHAPTVCREWAADAIREALREAAAVLRAQAELVEREYRLVYGTGTCLQAVGLRDGAKLVRALGDEARGR